MNKETFKCIKDLYLKIKKEDDLNKIRDILANDILNIIRVEDAKINMRFNLFDYISSDAANKCLHGIYYNDGYKVATDAHILIAIKATYPADYEKKVLMKNGKLIRYYDFPEWKKVAFADIVYYRSITIDLNKVNDILKEIKIQNKLSDEPFDKIKIDNIYYRLDLFIKFYRAMKFFGTNVILYNERWSRSEIIKDENLCLLMSINPPKNDFKTWDATSCVIK